MINFKDIIEDATNDNFKNVTIENTTLEIRSHKFDIKNVTIEDAITHTARRNNLKNHSKAEIKDYCTTGFSRKSGIKYCKHCGSENKKTIENCISCNAQVFLDSHMSEIIGGYLALAKIDKLRKYYNRINKNSKINMNPKRMIYYLLLHKDNLTVELDDLKIVLNCGLK